MILRPVAPKPFGVDHYHHKSGKDFLGNLHTTINELFQSITIEEIA